MTLGDPFICMREVCCWGKMSADGKPTRGRTRIITDSARKRNRKEALANYNKTKFYVSQNILKDLQFSENHSSEN